MKITQLRFVLAVVDLVKKAQGDVDYTKIIDYIIYKTIDLNMMFRAHTENTLGTAIVSASPGFSAYAMNIAINIPIGRETELEEDFGPVFFFKSKDYELRLRAYYVPEGKRFSDGEADKFKDLQIVVDVPAQIISMSGMEAGNRFAGDTNITVNLLEDIFFGSV